MGWRAVAAVCGNNRVYFSQTDISKGSHGRRENETKVQTGACEVFYLVNDSKLQQYEQIHLNPISILELFKQLQWAANKQDSCPELFSDASCLSDLTALISTTKDTLGHREVGGVT